MIAYLFLGLVVLVAVVLLMRWAVNTDPAQLARIIRIAAIVMGVAGGLLLVWRAGAAGLFLFVLGGLVLLMLRRGRPPQVATGPSGASSGLQTATLDMSLDHDSGRLDGTVKQGPYAGRRLSTLSIAQVLELLAECRGADPDSTPVLEAFLDRGFGPEWRQREGSGGESRQAPDPRRPTMSREEALDVLGLTPAATADDIREAHRRLMQKVHPDHGGSSYLAARINLARDVLLGA